MERLIIFAAGIAAFAVVVLAAERIRRARPRPSAQPPPPDEVVASDPAACVRCGAPSSTDAPLIATPEGWMCERCYAEAK